MARQKKDKPVDQFTTAASLGLVVQAPELTAEQTEKPVEVTPEISAIPVDKGDDLVQCRPKFDGSIYVGSKTWRYKGGEINHLPRTVKEILRSHNVLDAL